MSNNDGALTTFADSRFRRDDDFRISPAKLEKHMAAAKPGDHVLDLGCGSGALGHELLRRRLVGFYVGIDVASQALNMARTADLTVVKADVSKRLPLATGWADLIYAAEIIEHVFDTDRFVQEMKRLLKPGGRIVLTTPNAASLGRRLLLAMGRNPYLEFAAGPHDAGHIRYFLSGTLHDVCARNGLNVTSLESDYVNFHSSGRWHSERLASLFPTLGRSLIAQCKKRD